MQRITGLREKIGRGLYGSSCSREESVHIRTNFYGMDSADLVEYPFKITEFGYGRVFEVGDVNHRFSLLDWCSKKGMETIMVYWDSVHFLRRHWFDEPNTFRKGDQSNLLVWDRQVDYYRCASKQGRELLNRLAYGNTPS